MPWFSERGVEAWWRGGMGRWLVLTQASAQDYRTTTADGTVDGGVLGYGLSGGQGLSWVVLPCVARSAGGTKRNCTNWWGRWPRPSAGVPVWLQPRNL